jgi:hypothetical protein
LDPKNFSKDLADKITASERKIRTMKALRLLADTDEWKAIEHNIGMLVAGKIESLCRPDTAHEKSIELRSWIAALRWLLEVPKVSEAEFQRAVAAVDSLRSQAARMHTLGIGTSQRKVADHEVDQALGQVESTIGHIP